MPATLVLMERDVLRTSDLDYELPADRIAMRPAEPRDSARLMVVGRAGSQMDDPAAQADAGITGLHVQHRIVRELPALLRPGDLLVFNVTRVLPARFRGMRAGSGGKIEGLYLHEGGEVGGQSDVRLGMESRGTLVWTCLIRGRHTRAGAVLELHDREGVPSGTRLVVLGRPREEPEAWTVRVEGGAAGLGTPEVLGRVGLPPLPPYIIKARKDHGLGDAAEDAEWYQTVYARVDQGPPAASAAGCGGAGGGMGVGGGGAVGGSVAGGSVAAPTAGLHFTPELLKRLDDRGIERAEVVLHVGAGTFRPVETEFVEQHPMHAEWCSMSSGVARRVQELRAQRAGGGGRIIAVGTTALRTLEAYAAALERGADEEKSPPRPPPTLHPEWLSTRLLISPGYHFRWCDGMMTNFHLPRSTLMALVAAMLEAQGLHRRAAGGPPGHEGAPSTGVERLKRLYEEAVLRKYRFYSFGDAMLIV